MIHQPYGGVGGTSSDIQLQAKEILELKKVTTDLMARFTGQPIDRIKEDSERDFYMSPEAALKYGIVDQIAKTSAPSPLGTTVKTPELNSVK
jgi:ATP-dependent Clp protease protease subunit